MQVLVLGANGATGFNVVVQLLNKGMHVKAMARRVEKFDSIKDRDQLETIHAGILEIETQKLKQHLSDADGVISCLGHNITLKGIFGRPYRLVTDALIRIVDCVNEMNKNKTLKLMLMSTTGCINKLQNEGFGKAEDIVMRIMRNLLPPQRDNESALGYLIDKVGMRNERIEWIAVRPDTLINESKVSEYAVLPSTIRSPVFDAGRTSRINVADFMARLLEDKGLWERWKYRTPVIYNKESLKPGQAAPRM